MVTEMNECFQIHKQNYLSYLIFNPFYKDDYRIKIKYFDSYEIWLRMQWLNLKLAVRGRKDE